MSKTSKILIILFIAIALICMCSKVFASYYTSYLDMLAGNTTVTGIKRNYDAGNHEISLHVTQLPYGNVRMYMALYKHGWFGSTSKVSEKTVDFYSTGTTYSYDMGNHPKADYHYFFSTFGDGRWGSFYADPVISRTY